MAAETASVPRPLRTAASSGSETEGGAGAGGWAGAGAELQGGAQVAACEVAPTVLAAPAAAEAPERVVEAPERVVEAPERVVEAWPAGSATGDPPNAGAESAGPVGAVEETLAWVQWRGDWARARVKSRRADGCVELCVEVSLLDAGGDGGDGGDGGGRHGEGDEGGVARGEGRGEGHGEERGEGRGEGRTVVQRADELLLVNQLPEEGVEDMV